MSALFYKVKKTIFIILLIKMKRFMFIIEFYFTNVLSIFAVIVDV